MLVVVRVTVLVDVVHMVKPRRASLVPDDTAATSSAMEPCSCSCCSAIISGAAFCRMSTFLFLRRRPVQAASDDVLWQVKKLLTVLVLMEMDVTVLYRATNRSLAGSGTW